MRVEQGQDKYYSFTFNKTSIHVAWGLTKQSPFE